MEWQEEEVGAQIMLLLMFSRWRFRRGASERRTRCGGGRAIVRVFVSIGALWHVSTSATFLFVSCDDVMNMGLIALRRCLPVAKSNVERF
jgi:hypothetical protein